MGIYDREYYRDGSRGSGWFSGIAPVCKTIIAINVAVFLLQILFRESFPTEWLDARGSDVLRHGQVWRLVTSSFLHDSHGFFHIAFNMLALWFLGRDVEEIYGGREFGLMYLAGAVVSTLVFCVIDSMSPAAIQAPAIGASGAVFTVVVVYTMYYPTREILLMFFFPMQMWLLLVLILAGDLLGLIQSIQGSRFAGTAFASHLGGAAYGYLYKRFDIRFSRLAWSWRRKRRPRFRVVSAESAGDTISRSTPPSVNLTSPMGATESRRSSSVAVEEDDIEERLDEILAKIAREGREHLSEEENRILEEASRRARNRRRERI